MSFQRYLFWWFVKVVAGRLGLVPFREKSHLEKRHIRTHTQTSLCSKYYGMLVEIRGYPHYLIQLLFPSVCNSQPHYTESSWLQFCKVHPTSELIHIGCECYWFVRDKETHWEVEHHGTHRHLVPPPTQAHPNSLKILEAHMRTAPELIPVQLSTGRQTRLPMRDVDPVFINQDYLSHRMKQIRRRINKDLISYIVLRMVWISRELT